VLVRCPVGLVRVAIAVGGTATVKMWGPRLQTCDVIRSAFWEVESEHIYAFYRILFTILGSSRGRSSFLVFQ
jgi:hypothetical protein